MVSNATRSPTFSRVSPDGNSTISPATSWPVGNVCGSVRELVRCRSDPQIPVRRTLIKADPGNISGIGTSLDHVSASSVIKRCSHGHFKRWHAHLGRAADRFPFRQSGD